MKQSSGPSEKAPPETDDPDTVKPPAAAAPEKAAPAAAADPRMWQQSAGKAATKDEYSLTKEMFADEAAHRADLVLRARQAFDRVRNLTVGTRWQREKADRDLAIADDKVLGEFERWRDERQKSVDDHDAAKNTWTDGLNAWSAPRDVGACALACSGAAVDALPAGCRCTPQAVCAYDLEDLPTPTANDDTLALRTAWHFSALLSGTATPALSGADRVALAKALRGRCNDASPWACFAAARFEAGADLAVFEADLVSACEAKDGLACVLVAVWAKGTGVKRVHEPVARRVVEAYPAAFGPGDRQVCVDKQDVGACVRSIVEPLNLLGVAPAAANPETPSAVANPRAAKPAVKGPTNAEVARVLRPACISGDAQACGALSLLEPGAFAAQRPLAEMPDLRKAGCRAGIAAACAEVQRELATKAARKSVGRADPALGRNGSANDDDAAEKEMEEWSALACEARDMSVCQRAVQVAINAYDDYAKVARFGAWAHNFEPATRAKVKPPREPLCFGLPQWTAPHATAGAGVANPAVKLDRSGAYHPASVADLKTLQAQWQAALASVPKLAERVTAFEQELTTIAADRRKLVDHDAALAKAVGAAQWLAGQVKPDLAKGGAVLRGKMGAAQQSAMLLHATAARDAAKRSADTLTGQKAALAGQIAAETANLDTLAKKAEAFAQVLELASQLTPSDLTQDFSAHKQAVDALTAQLEAAEQQAVAAEAAIRTSAEAAGVDVATNRGAWATYWKAIAAALQEIIATVKAIAAALQEIIATVGVDAGAANPAPAADAKPTKAAKRPAANSAPGVIDRETLGKRAAMLLDAANPKKVPEKSELELALAAHLKASADAAAPGAKGMEVWRALVAESGVYTALHAASRAKFDAGWRKRVVGMLAFNIEALRREIKATETALVALRKDVEAVQAHYQAAADKLAKAQDDLAQAVDKAATDRDALAKAIAKLVDDVGAEMRSNLEALNANVAANNEKIAELNKREAHRRDALTWTKARHAWLTSNDKAIRDAIAKLADDEPKAAARLTDYIAKYNALAAVFAKLGRYPSLEAWRTARNLKRNLDKEAFDHTTLVDWGQDKSWECATDAAPLRWVSAAVADVDAEHKRSGYCAFDRLRVRVRQLVSDREQAYGKLEAAERPTVADWRNEIAALDNLDLVLFELEASAQRQVALQRRALTDRRNAGEWP
ncbi:MAG: hypothetical protein FJ100_20905 [Deltaproteobacteria bacterium]|nr:hypothetical protein [Deltaproteobacteria bacterium]